MSSRSAYQHSWQDGAAGLPVGKVVCVGRNYADHAKELDNPVPTEPILFIKPATSITAFAEGIQLPGFGGACHFETELALLIGSQLSEASAEDALAAVAGVGLALDLTLRELQSQLKEKGHPWEKSKAFDGSCPLSPFVPAEQVVDWRAIELTMRCNGELRQQGSSAEMITPVDSLLAYISRYFTLHPGDVVLTGTPAGVGALQSGDSVTATLTDLLTVETRVR